MRNNYSKLAQRDTNKSCVWRSLLWVYRLRKGRHGGQLHSITESIEIWEDQYGIQNGKETKYCYWPNYTHLRPYPYTHTYAYMYTHMHPHVCMYVYVDIHKVSMSRCLFFVLVQSNRWRTYRGWTELSLIKAWAMTFEVSWINLKLR